MNDDIHAGVAAPAIQMSTETFALVAREGAAMTTVANIERAAPSWPAGRICVAEPKVRAAMAMQVNVQLSVGDTPQFLDNGVRASQRCYREMLARL